MELTNEEKQILINVISQISFQLQSQQSLTDANVLFGIKSKLEQQLEADKPAEENKTE